MFIKKQTQKKDDLNLNKKTDATHRVASVFVIGDDAKLGFSRLLRNCAHSLREVR